MSKALVKKGISLLKDKSPATGDSEKKVKFAPDTQRKRARVVAAVDTCNDGLAVVKRKRSKKLINSVSTDAGVGVVCHPLVLTD